MRRLTVVLSIALAGCAARFEREMSHDVNHLTGKDIHVAIKRLGYPTQDERIASDHVYRWVMTAGGTAVTARRATSP